MDWTALIVGVISAAAAWYSAKQDRDAKEKAAKAGTSSTTTPKVNPAYAPLQDAMISHAMKSLNEPLPAGYETKGIESINSTYDAAGKGLMANLVARGQAASPSGTGAMANMTSRRAGDIAGFRASLPQIEEQRRQEALKNAMGLLGGGTGSTTIQIGPPGYSPDPNSVAGNNLAATLGYMYANRNYKTPTNPKDNSTGGTGGWRV